MIVWRRGESLESTIEERTRDERTVLGGKVLEEAVV